MIKEDIHTCSYSCENPECIKAQRDELVTKYLANWDKHYDAGWNSALEMAAGRISNIRGFGQATQDSFSVFIKGLKK